MYEEHFPSRRYQRTLNFIKSTIDPDERILDLGIENPFSEILRKNGYQVNNTHGEDLDIDTSVVRTSEYDVVTAFQIFEHMVAPFNILRDIKANKLIASVPLKLWFSKAYRNDSDSRDRHYHEFEDWQFDWLLEKAGWEIKKSEKFSNPIMKIGIRPLLRSFTPRFYLIYAERNQ
jgi:hypothetical protein